MAYPSTSNNLTSSHSSGQTITSADINAIAVDVDQLTLKAGTGSSTPTAGTVWTGTGTGTSAWQAPTVAALTEASRTTGFTLASGNDISICNGTFIITLPAGNGGIAIRPYYFKNIGTGVITFGGQTVDGVSNPTLALQWDGIILIPDSASAGWYSF